MLVPVLVVLDSALYHFSPFTKLCWEGWGWCLARVGVEGICGSEAVLLVAWRRSRRRIWRRRKPVVGECRW